jgi:ribonuclease HI
MAVKKKYYVVWQGNNPGIYSSWEECLAQVKSYPAAKYKAFSSLEEARDAFVEGPVFSSIKKEKKETTDHWKKDIPLGSVVVDAACSGNPGDMEYQGLDLFSGQTLFHKGPFKKGTNNIGEFLAIVHGLAYLKHKGDKQSFLVSDSKIAISWIRQKKCNTKLHFDYRNQELKQVLDRAMKWLHENTIDTRIILWDTKKWGENPADFGRK